MTKAIQIVGKRRTGGSDLLMQAVIYSTVTLETIAYLAFSKKEMRSIWLHHKLDQVAHNAAILDFSMLPADNTWSYVRINNL